MTDQYLWQYHYNSLTLLLKIACVSSWRIPAPTLYKEQNPVETLVEATKSLKSNAISEYGMYPPNRLWDTGPAKQ